MNKIFGTFPLIVEGGGGFSDLSWKFDELQLNVIMLEHLFVNLNLTYEHFKLISKGLKSQTSLKKSVPNLTRHWLCSLTSTLRFSQIFEIMFKYIN